MIPKIKELYLPLFRVLRKNAEISLRDAARMIAVDMNLSVAFAINDVADINVVNRKLEDLWWIKKILEDRK